MKTEVEPSVVTNQSGRYPTGCSVVPSSRRTYSRTIFFSQSGEMLTPMQPSVEETRLCVGRDEAEPLAQPLASACTRENCRRPHYCNCRPLASTMQVPHNRA